MEFAFLIQVEGYSIYQYNNEKKFPEYYFLMLEGSYLMMGSQERNEGNLVMSYYNNVFHLMKLKLAHSKISL